jgi:hypothetical protein
VLTSVAMFYDLQIPAAFVAGTGRSLAKRESG